MLKQKSHQSNKHMDSAPCKILGTIFEIDQEGTQTYWMRKLMMMHKYSHTVI